MIGIWKNLFIGGEDAYERRVRHEAGWRVVHACKEPYHRAAVGYTGRACPKSHPEYLLARRSDRLILNLIDAPDPSFIPDHVIDEALRFVHESLEAGLRVLVHCNKGESRAPAIGFLYLICHTNMISARAFEEAEAQFRRIYPPYTPSAGVRGFVARRFKECRAEQPGALEEGRRPSGAGAEGGGS